MAGELDDPRRTEPAFGLGEREMLEGWLEFHRTTLELKCEGLDDAQRKAQPVPTSVLSLHGLVRHMAEVERQWFRKRLDEDADAYYRWPDDTLEDPDIAPLDDAVWADDLLAWREDCESSRQVAARHGLDDAGDHGGEPCTLRWIYVHMIEEYARHNGHADLLRELVDGAVGW